MFFACCRSLIIKLTVKCYFFWWGEKIGELKLYGKLIRFFGFSDWNIISSSWANLFGLKIRKSVGTVCAVCVGVGLRVGYIIIINVLGPLLHISWWPSSSSVIITRYIPPPPLHGITNGGSQTFVKERKTTNHPKWTPPPKSSKKSSRPKKEKGVPPRRERRCIFIVSYRHGARDNIRTGSCAAGYKKVLFFFLTI